MARVTVEDCVEKVANRFDLVMMAAHRAREISAGAPITVDRDNDKNPVIALREIADETVPLDGLQESLVRGHQKHVSMDEPEEEVIELMTGEEEWLRQAEADNAGEAANTAAEEAESAGEALLDGEEASDPLETMADADLSEMVDGDLAADAPSPDDPIV